MLTSRAHIRSHLAVGPGGTHCHCCFPVKHRGWRKAKFRSAKRKEARTAFKIEAAND